MTLRRLALAALLAAGMLGGGCAEFTELRLMTMPAAEADQALYAARKAKARKLTRKGDLAGALIQWKVLEAIDSDDPEVREQRISVTAAIERRAGKSFEKGQKAIAENRTKDAERHFLAVLKLDPSHEAALGQLRRLEATRVRDARRRLAARLEQRKRQASVTAAAREAAAAKAKAEKAAAAKVKPASPPKAEAAVRTVKPEKPAPAKQAAETTKAGTDEDGRPDSSAPSSTTQVALRSPGGNENKVSRAPAKRSSRALDEAIKLAQAGSYQASLPHLKRHLARYPGDKAASELLASLQGEVGLSLYKDGKLRESLPHLEASAIHAAGGTAVKAALLDAKGRLAEEAYNKGLRALHLDVAKAIDFWEETLTYDPEHAKAQKQLRQAYKIRDTLQGLAQ